MNYQQTIDRLAALRKEQGILAQKLVDEWAIDEKNRNRPKRQSLSSELISYCANPIGFSMTLDKISKELI